MRNWTRTIAALALGLAMSWTTGCEEEVDVDPALFGYWLECRADNGSILVDGDGFGWGFELNRSGDLTTARADSRTSTIVTEARGPFGHLSHARNGIWQADRMDLPETPTSGVYSLGSVMGTSGTLQPILTIDLMGTTTYVKAAELQ